MSQYLAVKYNQAEPENEPEPLSPGIPTPNDDDDENDVIPEFPSSPIPETPLPPLPNTPIIQKPYIVDDHEHSEQTTTTTTNQSITTSDTMNATNIQNEGSFETQPIHDIKKHDDYDGNNDDDIKQNSSTMTLTEFNKVSLEDIISNDISLRDNYDIAKKICKYFDDKFNDTDTVCMVAEIGKQPEISYWCKGEFVRKHTNICGKHILLYRACEHIKAKSPIVTKNEFEKYVKKISIEHENSSVTKICDILDSQFGAGCHYARSNTKKPQYDIYCRFSNKYECGFRLPRGAYIISWRR